MDLLATATNEQLADEIERGLLDEWGRDDEHPNLVHLRELLRRANADEPEAFVLPYEVAECVRRHFGGGRRTFDAITKRVRFAYKVWQDKYGPWTPEQAEYAERLVIWTINKGCTVAPNPQAARPMVYTWLDRVLHHENTHQGFQARAGETFDINADLQEDLI